MGKSDATPEVAQTQAAGTGTVTIGLDVLSELIEAKVAARLADLKVADVRTLDEKFTADMSAIRGKGAPLAPEELHPCESPQTGATFTARVLKSRGFPQGRVVELLDYKHPESASRLQDEGGAVPKGLEMQSNGVNYRHWKYVNYWQRDLADLVGRPFQSYYLATEAERRRAFDAGTAA